MAEDECNGHGQKVLYRFGNIIFYKKNSFFNIYSIRQEEQNDKKVINARPIHFLSIKTFKITIQWTHCICQG